MAWVKKGQGVGRGQGGPGRGLGPGGGKGPVRLKDKMGGPGWRKEMGLCPREDSSTEIDSEKQLELGIEVEREHLDTIKRIIKEPENQSLIDKAIESIARDHLKEMPDYYTRLKKMESEK